MIAPSKKPHLDVNCVSKAEVPAAHADPLHVLERFARQLQHCRGLVEATRLFLTAVQQSLWADLVYTWSATGAEPLEFVGRRRPPANWCQDFVRQLLTDTAGTDGYLLRSKLPIPTGGGAQPHSAALVPLSPSRSVWAAALRYDPANPFAPGDLKILLLARRILVNYHQHYRLQEKLKDTVLGLIHSFTTAIDAKDRYTAGHSERVARIALRLGQEMQLPEETLSDLYLAGLLHDIGKIGIRDDVLQKAGPLTDAEFSHLQKHAAIGHAIVSKIKQLAHLCPGVRGHHERYDGLGYPDGLAGAGIPLLARILAVADSCDAMMFDRPYRPARSPRLIDAIMAEGAGKQWDPGVIGQFQKCCHELYPICQKGLGESAFVAVGHVVAADQDKSLQRADDGSKNEPADIS